MPFGAPHLPAVGIAFAVLLPLSALAEAPRRVIWQPVQEYVLRRPKDRQPEVISGTRRLNSFRAYTHIGTDFGFHGPAEHEIEWKNDFIHVDLTQQPDAWAGMWHSLAGLARHADRVLDFNTPWPDAITVRFQPRISSVMLEARGTGRVKLEIKGPDESTLLAQSFVVQNGAFKPHVLPVDAASLTKAKWLNWTAEPGSRVTIDSLRLGVQVPDVPFQQYVVAASYAKLARCLDTTTGLIKDRAHLDEGAFDSISATGMFVLATAALAADSTRMVRQDFARTMLRQIHNAAQRLPRAMGLLPHFVSVQNGLPTIHPGTEFSTIDTAIYCHSMLLAAHILHDEPLLRALRDFIKQIEFDRLRLSTGEIVHGIKDDGSTLLRHGWIDWGGESALVMLLAHMADPASRGTPMRHPGRVWEGAGFIAEIQSLFYPDFDSDKPDALDGVRWHSARRALLDAQRGYLQQWWPGSALTKMGLYGLSAGENENGDGYTVSGTDLPGQSLVHPHYILMSGALAENPESVWSLLRRMEAAGWMLPWGLVENISVTGSSLPMQGSLNAAFETLGAYHLMARTRDSTDVIYDAAKRSPELRQAVRVFFPAAAKPVPMSAELRPR